jgi:nitrite reductase (NADH) large subunit
MASKIIIIGAGPAGVSVAETVRAHNNNSEIVILSAESYPPYSPPAMADHFLSNSQAHLWRGENWPENIGVDYRPGTRVMAIEPDIHQIQLEAGTSLYYDRLVIATGSRLHAPLEGAELPGVYNFKSLSAAEDLVQKVKSGEARKAIIVGAGFIGMEIALLLRALGADVIQVEMQDQVMPTMLDAATAEVALKIMREKGVDVRLNTKAVAFLGDENVNGVNLESGEVLKADIFIAATGVRPITGLLSGSDITFRWGIVVDDYLRTNQKDIYAAGDVVESRNRLTGEVYVHAIFPNAVEQGKIVGYNLLGYKIPYAGAERMNSLKHLGLPIMAYGLKSGDEVLRVHRNGNLRTLYLQNGCLVGFQLVGDIHPAGVFRTLIHRGQKISNLKEQLLEQTFGQGNLVWNALSPQYVGAY